MRLPIINGRNRYKKTTVVFGGLNLMKSYSEGELCECSGISHLAFPFVTQRQKSETIFECISPSAMVFAQKQCIAAEDGLYYDGKKVADLSGGEKNLAVLGDRVAVFPDKIFYDIKTGETGKLQGEFNSGGASVTFSSDSISVPEYYAEQESLVDKVVFNKDDMIITYQSATIKDAKLNLTGFALKNANELTQGSVFCEQCENNQYRTVISISESEDKESYIVTNELITVTNGVKDAFSNLREGDFVEISGCVTNKDNNLSAQIVSVEANKLIFQEGTFVSGTESSSVTVKRKIPDFNCVCSYENRLWGCEGNTIYASALGDMTNFFVYKNLSTDSYSVTSNSAGDFTACIPFGNCCLFFKENSCYKLYGNRPSNFQLTESFGGGISATDRKSLVSVNGRVIYKGNGGIYVCYGGVPQCVSQKLEGITMENAVCGSDGKRLYISADTKDGREEYVWDMEKNLWSRSSVADVLGYTCYGGIMYRMHKHGIEKLLETADEDTVWSITLCPFDEGYHKTKNYSRVYINAELFENACISVEVSCDDGNWRSIYTGYADGKKYLNIPCVIKSCHSFKLRISGKGKCVLESLTREFSIN